MSDDVFKTYKRTRVDTLSVATVTSENIGVIAAMIGGSVDYSGDEPVLIDPSKGRTFRIKIGWQISLIGDRIVNQNGFNTSGEWEEA